MLKPASYSTIPGQDRKYHIHYVLMVFGIFLLLQSLLAENFKNSAGLYNSIKYFDELFALGGFIFIFGYRILRGQKLEKTGIDWLLFIFLAFALTSSLVEMVPPFIFLSQVLLYLKGFFLFYIFLNLDMDLEILYKYKKVFFITAAIFFLLGLVDLVAPYEFRKITGNVTTIDYRSNIPSVKSLFDHPWAYGWFTSFTALYCFAEFYVSKMKKYLLAGIVFFIGCFLSMRFKALSGLTAALIMGLLLLPSRRKLKSVFVILGFLLIIAIFIGPSIMELLETKVRQYFDREAQFTMARNVFYIRSVTIARDYFPLGVGLGRYGSWLSRVYYSPIYVKYEMSRIWGLSKDFPHFINDTFWPMVLGETGFFGFIAYLLILSVISRTLYKELSLTQNPEVKAFYLGTLMILLESLIESIAAPVYTSPPPLYFIFSTIGICYAFKNKYRMTAA